MQNVESKLKILTVQEDATCKKVQTLTIPNFWVQGGICTQ